MNIPPDSNIESISICEGWKVVVGDLFHNDCDCPACQTKRIILEGGTVTLDDLFKQGIIKEETAWELIISVQREKLLNRISLDDFLEFLESRSGSPFEYSSCYEKELF